MTKKFKKLDPFLFQRKQNGYSIAEILLVFGIIAGVLIGVWAMYTLLGDKADAQAAIAEVQMLKKAAHKYKYAPGRENKYTGVTIAELKPYLGQSGIANGQNIFGTAITVAPGNSDRDLQVTYPGVRDLDICRQILNQFGQVKDKMTTVMMVTTTTLQIEAGSTISGYVGGDDTETGCTRNTINSTHDLNILID